MLSTARSDMFETLSHFGFHLTLLAAAMYILSASGTHAAPIHLQSVQNTHSIFSHHYVLVDMPTHRDKLPTFKRVEPHEIAVETQTRFGIDAIVGRKQGQRLDRRGYTFSFHVVNITTSSFFVQLNCTVPYGESPVLPDNELGTTCSGVVSSVRRAVSRLERSIFIRATINIRITFGSFCYYTDLSALGQTCPVSDSTLGYAVPTGWHVFNASEAPSYGTDSNYVYPSALAKQYAPTDPAFTSGSFDVDANINSDVNWWFASQTDSMGRSDSDVWGDYNPIFGGSSASKDTKRAYDFEQVTMHEIIHGLGFISSWAKWYDSYTFLPSFVEVSGNGTATKLAPPYVFTRWMSDTVNGVWLRTYDDAIRKAVNSAIAATGGQNWYSVFNKSVGAEIARALGASNGIFRNPGGVAVWYPSSASSVAIPGKNGAASQIWGSPDAYRFAYLHTPRIFADGSSISHLDNTVYSGTSDFLMRSAATLRSGIDSITPMAAQGPLGEATLGILRSIGYVTK